MNKVYFPGLNGLRFIAAFFVFIAHTEHLKSTIGALNFSTLHFFQVAGAAGVDLFFSISGYLITYLLLIEKDNYKTVKLRDFYIRRILRIWPLYYFILLVTLIVIPAFIKFTPMYVDGFIEGKGLFFFTFFMPYVAISFLPVNFMASVLWSVGVEETYYIFWPIIMQRFGGINSRVFLIGFCVFLSIKAVITFVPYKLPDPHHILHILSTVFGFLRIECMLIGGAFAWLVKSGNKIIDVLKNRYTFLGTVVVLVIFLIWGFHPLYAHVNAIFQTLLDPVFYAILCSIVIINVTTHPSLYRPLEHKLLYELGQISYGFYVYHCIAIFLTMLLLRHIAALNTAGVLFATLFFLLSLSLALIFSYISYYYFESIFLKMKGRFTHIISGAEAKKHDNN